jgi:translation initiation factor 4G
MLLPLESFGLKPLDQASLGTRGGPGRHRQGSGAAPPPRQASVGLGLGPSSSLGKSSPTNLPSMGNFTTNGSKLSSDERFANSTSHSASMNAATALPFNRPVPASQGGAGGALPRDRTRSERRRDRNEMKKVQQGDGSDFNNFQANAQSAKLEPVAPLQVSANRWDRKAIHIDPDSPELVDRKVKALLNKLTMENFNSISDQVIPWANKSEKEKDGRTLVQVVGLVFEKATDEAIWSEMYARLCRKMVEQISLKVQDDGIKKPQGKPIAGGQLFRKHLLDRCQEGFERGWVAKEATAAAAAAKALEDEAAKAANRREGGPEGVALYSDEYYAAQKVKRQGLGLIKFIGELFKLQMLTQPIMRGYVKILLGNVESPEEVEIESLCKLLAAVGASLDTQKARAHMDVYFSRMKELTKSHNFSSRMQFMLQVGTRFSTFSQSR